MCISQRGNERKVPSDTARDDDVTSERVDRGMGGKASKSHGPVLAPPVGAPALNLPLNWRPVLNLSLN